MPVDPDVFLQLHYDVVVRTFFARPTDPHGSPFCSATVVNGLRDAFQCPQHLLVSEQTLVF